MKINLIFFLSDFTLGGAGNSILRLCEHFSKNSLYTISIISLGHNPYKSKFKKKIKFIELKKQRLLSSIFVLYHEIKNILDPQNKNILISNIHYNNVVSIALFRRIKYLKIILVERTPLEELDIFFSITSFIKNKLLKFLIRYFYNFADKIVVNSYGIKNGLKKLTSNKIKVIYPPSIKYINKNNNSKNKKNIIVISRLSREKKIDIVIKAYATLNLKHKLLIYGVGPEYNKLKKLIKTKNLNHKIFLMGYISDPNSVLKNSKIFILNSIFEGCSNSIIEALNNNNIVLCSDCPGGNSEIILNGRGGTFFKTNDFIDLSNKIGLIINNYEKYFNKSNYAKKYLNRFTFISNFQKYERLFKTI